MQKMLLALLAKDQKKPLRQLGELATSSSYTEVGLGSGRKEGDGQHIHAASQPQHKPAASTESKSAG